MVDKGALDHDGKFRRKELESGGRVRSPAQEPGRGGLDFIPLVRRGETTIMVSTPQEAEELVAFLNYCGMSEFAAG